MLSKATQEVRDNLSRSYASSSLNDKLSQLGVSATDVYKQEPELKQSKLSFSAGTSGEAEEPPAKKRKVAAVKAEEKGKTPKVIKAAKKAAKEMSGKSKFKQQGQKKDGTSSESDSASEVPSASVEEDED